MISAPVIYLLLPLSLSLSLSLCLSLASLVGGEKIGCQLMLELYSINASAQTFALLACLLGSLTGDLMQAPNAPLPALLLLHAL